MVNSGFSSGRQTPAPKPTPSAPPRSDPDVERMRRVCADEPGAFEELLAAYQHRVVGVLYHMVGSRDDAEDLAQEVFLRVYRNRKNYRPDAKFSTWLFTITSNLALNAIRDKKRRPTAAAPATESGPMGARPLEHLAATPSGATPSRLFAKGELAEVVRAAVALLPEEQRLAVMLNKFEAMSYRQIAQIMDRSEMAVKSLLARARSTLREILDPYFERGDRPVH